jgi:hypothetical protein
MGNAIPGGTSAAVNSMCEGNYTIEGTDANGCSTGVLFAVIGGFPEITANVFAITQTVGLPMEMRLYLQMVVIHLTHING